MFNLWYWFWLIISIGSTVGLYFLLRKKSQKTQKIVLFSILVLGLVAHFTKFLYPPYSTDPARMLRDSWFVNICGANIGLFPFMFFSKNKRVKDYMFYLGLLGGLVATLVPLEPIAKVNQAAEWIDIVRFYFHHTMLYAVPLLMVLLGLHKLSYKRVLWCPVYLLGVMLFIMLNQIFQSELGFIPLSIDLGAWKSKFCRNIDCAMSKNIQNNSCWRIRRTNQILAMVLVDSSCFCLLGTRLFCSLHDI